MFLMLEHNTKEYISFLRTLKVLKLNLICCCCGSVIINQLLELDVKSDQNIISDGLDNCTKEETEYETHDISDHHGEIGCKELDLSIKTPDV